MSHASRLCSSERAVVHIFATRVVIVNGQTQELRITAISGRYLLQKSHGAPGTTTIWAVLQSEGHAVL